MTPLLLLLAIPSGQSFECDPISVYDGDGPILCRNGVKIRLAGIAAREMDGTCRINQPCPAAGAEAARDALAALLGTPGPLVSKHRMVSRAPALQCLPTGQSYQRVTAWCGSERVPDVSCAMVASGYAVVWSRYWKGHRC